MTSSNLPLILTGLIFTVLVILVILIITRKNKVTKFQNNTSNINSIPTTTANPLISYIEQQDLLLDPSYYVPYSYDWYSVNYPYWYPYWLPYGGWDFGYYWPGYGYNYNRYRDWVNHRRGGPRPPSSGGPRPMGGSRSGGHR